MQRLAAELGISGTGRMRKGDLVAAISARQVGGDYFDFLPHANGRLGITLGDVDRDKYVAIGESDRMTLKFVKPQ